MITLQESVFVIMVFMKSLSAFKFLFVSIVWRACYGTHEAVQ